MTASAQADRARQLRVGLRLEYLTIGWNVIEAAVALWAAALAGSVALLGFGIDSVIESASGAILVWRLRAEGGADERARRRVDADAVERLERRAEQFVGLSLVTLAAYVVFDAATTLASGERPSASPVGLAVTAISLGVMGWLAGAKRRAARALGSRALEADAFQTTACLWLSAVVLAGVGANAALGWWWADPVAAIGAALLIGREGIEAWHGEGHDGGAA